MSEQNFKVMMNLAKSFERTSADGTTHMIVSGLASGLNIDHQDDRMAQSAVEAFKKAIDEGIVLPDGRWSLIPLRTGHRLEWSDILGWITKADIDEDHNLWIEAELDERSGTAQTLFKNLTQGDRPGKPLQLGLSVGGKITQASHEWNPTLNKKVRVIEGVKLDEISVVGSPANPITYVEALSKSINWADVPLPKEELLLNKECSMSNELSKTEAAVAQVDAAAATAEAAPTTEAVAPVSTQTVPPTQEATSAASASTENTDATSTSAVVENAPSETSEEVKTDPQDNDQILSAVASLKDAVAKLTETVSTMQSANGDASTTKSEAVEAKTEVTLEKAEPKDESLKEMLSGLFNQFAVDFIAPLKEQLDMTKSQIAELENEPADKSVALAKTKTTEKVTALDAFNERMEKARESKENVNPIAEAVRLSGLR
jgi:hypothetical protein